tara:strand:+ start:1871 stop:2191 length:321 start_codon:yes stop_codon:yes gene_type:complete
MAPMHLLRKLDPVGKLCELSAPVDTAGCPAAAKSTKLDSSSVTLMYATFDAVVSAFRMLAEIIEASTTSLMGLVKVDVKLVLLLAPTELVWIVKVSYLQFGGECPI